MGELDPVVVMKGHYRTSQLRMLALHTACMLEQGHAGRQLRKIMRHVTQQ